MTTIRPPDRSVFLGEDEAIIRMMIADMLEELGYSIAAEASNVTSAFLLARSEKFDLAILDVKLDGEMISPVAEVLKASSVPFFFASGYGSPPLPEAFHGYLTLQKPFQIEGLALAISETMKTGKKVH
jgi:CheY-like chemotaxis protein